MSSVCVDILQIPVSDTCVDKCVDNSQYFEPPDFLDASDATVSDGRRDVDGGLNALIWGY